MRLTIFVLLFYVNSVYGQELKCFDLINTKWIGAGDKNKNLVYIFNADSTFIFEEIGKNTTFASFDANYNPVPETGMFSIKNKGSYAEIDIYYESSPELREKGLIRFVNEDEIELGFNMSYFEPRPKAWNEARDIIKLRRIKE
ncbi:MAG TPA: hypothetical protein ENN33_00980 [Ignavibacteria bacterium]|nr:hypothetical protein [Ignavibacteria bacterium]